MINIVKNNNKKNRIIVYDAIFSDTLLNNGIFDFYKAKKVSHTMLPICELRNECVKRNIKIITSDIYLSCSEYYDENVVLFSHMVTNNTKKLIELGARPILLFCQESPFIATRFYLNLLKISSQFKYSFVFSGMLKRLGKKTNYIEMFFPSSFDSNKKICKDFDSKKVLTFISSNKKVSNILKSILLKLFYGFSVKNIYKKRIDIVEYFAKEDFFDLYGFGWGSSKKNIIENVYKGVVKNKIETMSNYKFSICFENTIFKGYITEKIFDCFFAGTVPIYYGAQNIEEYIPKNCFIDYRHFKNDDELKKFLITISKKEYNEYIDNINIFLESKTFFNFTSNCFIDKILDIFEKEFKQYA